MSLHRSALSAFLSIVLLETLPSPALAWDLFKKRHYDDCDAQTIRLPAQRVNVETTAPRVTVHETTRVSRGIGPVVGTIYMPVAMPFPGVGISRESELIREDDYDALRTAHVAERAALRQEQARSALRAEVEAKQRVLDRLGPATLSGATPASADLDKRLKELSDQISRLTDRVAAVEKLTLIHDNYLRDQLKKTPPEPIAAPKAP